MTTKHAPATPLPETVCASRGLLFGEYSGRTLTYEQHEEVARRANLYPRLVEVLRNARAHIPPDTREGWEPISELLREIGEDA